MNVLSLFDGISCGMLALERAGVNVNNYVSFEIEKNALTISKKNFPNIKQRGSVIGADFSEFAGFDMLIGGSPCQDLSCMGSRKGLEGEKSKLFFEYLRALETIHPRYFLLENNASMTVENQDKITKYLGVTPVMINSADFSAQNRKRLYWSNIPISKHVKKNILIKDIYQYDVPHKIINDVIEKYVTSGVYKGRKIEKTTKNAIRTLNEKSRTIGCYSYDISSNCGLAFKYNDDYVLPTLNEFERLQTLPDNYTECVPYKKAVYCIGNGWTVDVIAHIFKGVK